jgi:geranylgeranyl pyrophosphate synthase
MKSFIDDVLLRHLTYEGEQFHLLTTLYGIAVLNNSHEYHLKIAKCIELMKASTLIMDDFLDKSPLRNGIPSLYSKLGAEEAVLIAELLKSSAMIAFCEVLTEVPKLTCEDKHKCILLFEDTYRTVCLGQLEELRAIKKYLKFRSPIREKEYWQIIEKTTASFIQLPLNVGSIVSRFDVLTENALQKYGLNIGLAYQVRDDVIDLIGEPEITGKPLGGDIRERKLRLPVIRCFRNGCRTEISTLKKIYMKNQITNRDIKAVIEILNSTGSIRYCLAKVNDLCTKAVESLSSIHDNTMRKQLENVANLLLLEKEEMLRKAT